MPSINPDFWHSKFEKNVGRDLKTSTALVALGWHVAVVWECETKDAQILHAKLISIMKRTQ